MLKNVVKNVFKKIGYKIVKVPKNIFPFDMEKYFCDLYIKCKDYTLTSVQRMYSLYMSVEYVIKTKIPGDFVECGVWKGGSCMLIALTLLKMGETHKKIYLYDTYEGMAEPSSKDINTVGDRVANEIWRDSQDKAHNKWCYSPIEEVKENLISTGYPSENLILVKGKVENTIPDIIPEKISLLRLDTDFFESTYHEFVHLFPRLVSSGVIIIDDYGDWKGCREATDKYFNENDIKILLNRVDNTGRVGIKVDV